MTIHPRIHIEEPGQRAALLCPAATASNPLCVKGCITGALSSEDGVILIDQDKCVGCYTCVLACPYGAIDARTAKAGDAEVRAVH